MKYRQDIGKKRINEILGKSVVVETDTYEQRKRNKEVTIGVAASVGVVLVLFALVFWVALHATEQTYQQRCAAWNVECK